MDISGLVKDGDWYRGPARDWELTAYGFYPRGLSDLIYNNLRKIIEDDDKSEWANEMFDKCVGLLLVNKRWPDSMHKEYKKYIAKNRLDKFLSKIEYKRGKSLIRKYRSQKSMTRDPWVLFYAACIHLDRREFIVMKPPWWLWRPELWALRRALLGKNNNFRSFNKIGNLFPRKDFVVILDYYLNWSYNRKRV